jgi:hypothetical protein
MHRQQVGLGIDCRQFSITHDEITDRSHCVFCRRTTSVYLGAVTLSVRKENRP